jgi:hypothetical protein
MCGFLLAEDPDYEKCNNYDCLGDSPVPLLYKELDFRFPESKFILTVRNKEKWLNSMKWLFTHGKVKWNWKENIYVYHERFYGSRSFNLNLFSKFYDAYHRNVFNYFSERPNDLMTIRLEEGFDVEKICRFTGVPYRDIPDRIMNPRRNVVWHKRVAYNGQYNFWRFYQAMLRIRNQLKGPSGT